MQGLIKYFTYDWVKDIWLPAAGAILIPLAIAFFTWWFGASRAEKQKEMQELRDNLNFLVSTSLASINGLIFLGKRLEKIISQEKNALDIINGKKSSENFVFDSVCYGFVYEDVFKSIEEIKYSQCISYQPDFVVEISLIKSLLHSLERYMDERNAIVKSISECENKAIKNERNIGFIKGDYENISGSLAEVYRFTLLIRLLIGKVVKLNQDIKGLNLTPQLYSEEQLEFIKKAEEEYTKYSAQKQETQNA